MIRRLLLPLVTTLGLAFGQAAVAQGPPEGRAELHTDAPLYAGEQANAPIPAELHVENEGGSDDAGLCVIASILANGQYQSIPGLNVPGDDGQAGKGSSLWRAAKAAPGGYHPSKLADLVERVMPGEKYASFEDTDPAVLERLSAMGYPIGATMNTGELYGWQPIHHMISLLHFNREQDLACVVDNNKPGRFTWMSAREFTRRWVDGDAGWAWIWTRLEGAAETAVEAPILVVIATAAVVVFASTRRLALSH